MGMFQDMILYLCGSGMQGGINFFSQGSADAFGLRQVVHAGGLYPAQTAEAGQQAAAAFVADAGNLRQRRSDSGFAAFAAVATDGEAV